VLEALALDAGAADVGLELGQAILRLLRHPLGLESGLLDDEVALLASLVPEILAHPLRRHERLLQDGLPAAEILELPAGFSELLTQLAVLEVEPLHLLRNRAEVEADLLGIETAHLARERLLLDLSCRQSVGHARPSGPARARPNIVPPPGPGKRQNEDWPP